MKREGRLEVEWGWEKVEVKVEKKRRVEEKGF